MKEALYLEGYSGISGDMTVGALLDLGADQQVLMEALSSLPIDGYEVKISRVKKSAIDACDFNVILLNGDNHDHDMEYLHGHSHHEENHHHHDHEEGHDHDHEDHHAHDAEHGHHHSHRGMEEIQQIIEGANLTDRARNISLNIFNVLTEAEAAAHGTTVDQVHFHEVGAVDSIVDIVAVAVCIDNLGIEDVIVPDLCEGRGMVRCQHGLMPIPVPAVANITAAHHINLKIVDMEGELVTPTGAAIVAALRTDDKLPAGFSIKKVGVGAGKRDYERPSMLRAMLIQADETYDRIYKLESNIDDCTGEMLGRCMEELMAAGARDVHYIPVFMKKNRPAYELVAICSESQVQELEEIIFRETTTIGIRKIPMERRVLKRKMLEVETVYGTAKVKVCSLSEGERYYPEYESLKDLCEKSGKPYPEIFNAVLRACP